MVSRFEVEQLAKDQYGSDSQENINKVLFGDVYDSAYYVVYERFPKREKRSLFNRLNIVWFVPFFVLSIPVNYLLFGNWQVREESKAGRAIKFLIGELF